MNKTHLHFTYLGYDEQQANGNIAFPVTIDVWADVEVEALMKAQKICKRKSFYLKEVRECASCSVAQANNEVMKEMVEVLKGKDNS